MRVPQQVSSGFKRTLAVSRIPPSGRLCAQALVREYHGDPGPSSISNRHERRRQFQRSAALNEGRIAKRADRDALDRLLDTPSPTPKSHVRSSPSREVTFPTTRTPQSRLIPPSTSSPRRPPTSRTPSTLSDNVPRTDSFRRRTQGPQATHDENPYTTSTRLKRWIEKHRGVISASETEEVIKLVTDAKNHMVNAPVWNILLGYMGRQKKLDQMWKLYNDMKKRGIKPTSRTYSTMLNAYAGVAHGSEGLDFSTRPPEQRTLSRVTIIFEHAQAHINRCQAAVKPVGGEAEEKIGLHLPGVDLRDETVTRPEVDSSAANEIDLAPINAYLKFLGRHGLWEEMQRAFLSLDKSGPLAPDVVTYTTMFASLYHVSRARERTHGGAGGARAFAVGPIARGIWDQCVRQFEAIAPTITASRAQTSCGIDNALLTHVLRCFFRGRPEDQRLATALIQHVWGLASPGQAAIVSSITNTSSQPDSVDLPASMRSALPRLSVDVKSATSLISMLSSARKPNLATHFTHLFLSDTSLQQSFDIHFFRAAIHALAETGEIQAILGILDSYQPATGPEGWSVGIWKDALTAARWTGDISSALSLLRRATHLPEGVEFIDTRDKSDPHLTAYSWRPPNSQARDARGAIWFKPKPVEPDAYMVSTLLKTAMTKGKTEIRQAVGMYRYLKENGMISNAVGAAHAKRAREDNEILEKDMERALERLA